VLDQTKKDVAEHQTKKDRVSKQTSKLAQEITSPKGSSSKAVVSGVIVLWTISTSIVAQHRLT
jgi:hypothetical protein